MKYMEKKKSMNDARYQSSNSRSSNFNQILTHLGDVDYMEEGNPVELFKDYRITIDPFSSNRIVGVNKED